MPKNNYPKIFLYTGLFLISLFAFTNISEAATSVTQRNITWNFDGDYEVGQFVNGDYWVIDNGGGVVVASISPGSSMIGDRYINGSTLNRTLLPQGFDSSAGNHYDAQHNVGLTMPLVVFAPSSLISTISNPDAYSSEYQSFVDQAAILTVLTSTPPADAFRPGYEGTEKRIFRLSDINTSPLKSLPSPLTTLPDPTDIINGTKSPFLHGANTAHRYMHPMEFYGSNYYWPNEVFASMALYLHLNYSTEVKNQLLVNYMQIAIDMFALLKESPTGWSPDGGHNGEKLPIVFAAVLFNDTEMLEYLSRSGAYHNQTTINRPTNRVEFGDDAVHYINQYMVDITNAPGWCGYRCRRGLGEDYPYSSALIGMPEWGNRNAGFFDCTSDWSAPYRTIATGGSAYFPAVAVAVILLDGGKITWNNPAFFDYVDRYMAIANGDPDPFGYIVHGEVAGHRPGGLIGAMYDTYRADYDTDVIAPSAPINLGVL